MAYVPTLKTQYKEQIVPALMKEFGYSSIMQCPKLQKRQVPHHQSQSNDAQTSPERFHKISENYCHQPDC